MPLEQSTENAAGHKIFAKRYPHIAESIRLKRKMERLKKKLKTEKRSSKFQINRQMNIIKAKLRKIKELGNTQFKTIHKEKNGSSMLVNEDMQYIKDKNIFKCVVKEN